MFHKVFADSFPLERKGDDDSAYFIMGVPFDGTSTFRKGSRNGPRALREASYNFESYLSGLKVDLQDLSIFDAGDLDETHTVDDLQVIMDMELEALFSKHDFTTVLQIFLGGEHSLTPIILDFIVTRAEQFDVKIGVIYLDAHLDMRDEYHNLKYSHACSARRISEIVGPGNIIPMGVRSWSREEAEFIETLVSQDNFTFYQNLDVFDLGASNAGEMAVEKLTSNGCNRIYLSIDMDVLDPSEAPGVGNPEPDGLSYSEVLDIVAPAAKYLCGMDLVEMNPNYDMGITALVGARLIRQIIGMHYTTTIMK